MGRREKAARSESGAGFRVEGACGRVWFVPLEAVGEDYAEFLEQADGLSPEEARRRSESSEDFWPRWFWEQCGTWGDVERLGRLERKSSLFKTKAALDRRRAMGGLSIEEVGILAREEGKKLEAATEAAKIPGAGKRRL